MAKYYKFWGRNTLSFGAVAYRTDQYNFSAPFITNFTEKAQVQLWKDLIRQVAKHYVDIYGIKEVSQWNFESWNEPDHQKGR